MALPDTLYQTTKDERQAARMHREAKGLRKKAKRRGGNLSAQEQQDLNRAERFLHDHPVFVSEPEYETTDLA